MSNSTLLYKNLTFVLSNPMFRVGEEKRRPEMHLCPQALFPMAYGLRRTAGTEVTIHERPKNNSFEQGILSWF